MLINFLVQLFAHKVLLAGLKKKKKSLTSKEVIFIVAVPTTKLDIDRMNFSP